VFLRSLPLSCCGSLASQSDRSELLFRGLPLPLFVARSALSFFPWPCGRLGRVWTAVAGALQFLLVTATPASTAQRPGRHKSK
jgi:hypothetical protein